MPPCRCAISACQSATARCALCADGVVSGEESSRWRRRRAGEKTVLPFRETAGYAGVRLSPCCSMRDGALLAARRAYRYTARRRHHTHISPLPPFTTISFRPVTTPPPTPSQQPAAVIFTGGALLLRG